MGLAAFGCLALTRKKIPYRLRFLFAPFCLIFWMSAGIWNVQRHLSHYDPNFFAHHSGRDSAVWEGEIMEVSGTEYRRCIVRVRKRWDEQARSFPASGKLLVYPGNESLVEKGQIVLFSAGIREIPPPKNPLAFDNKRYRFFQNVHYQSYWKEDDFKTIGQRPPGILEQWRSEQLDKWREALKDPSVFAIASAMVFGYKNEMPEEIRTTYAETGASHVLAVSGLHVGLIYLFCSFLLRKLRWRLGKAVISLCVIWGFAFLTGATPSVLRASAMFSFVLVGQQMRRPISIYNSLAGSALFLLIDNPLWLFHIGFQLSYLAVLGIVIFQPLFYGWWIPSNGWADKIWTLITVSFAAQLATMPFTLYYFHQFPVYFWLSGLIVVPAAPLIIGLGLVLIVCTNWLPDWEWIPSLMLDHLIGLINGALEMIRAIPGSVATGIYLHGGAVALLLASLIFLAWIWENRSWRRLHWLLIALNAVSVSRCVTDAMIFFRADIAVYHTPGNTLIDFMYRGAMVTFRNEALAEKDEERAAGPLRQRRRITKREVVLLDKAVILEYPQEGLVIITGNANFDPGQWNAEAVIADASNQRKKAEMWKSECERRGWAFTDIRTNGAYVRKVEPRLWPFPVQAHR